MTNIGTTFSSSTLDKIYLVELKNSKTSKSVRYGVYGSCLYNDSKQQSCTSNLPAYSFDTNQFATLCGDNSTKSSTYKDIISSTGVNSLFKSIVIILPTTVLAFVAFSCTLLLRKNRDTNRIPLIGSFASLLSFLVGAAGLALVLVVFLKGLPAVEKKVDGLSHNWGAAIYLYGFGVFCSLGTFVCFIVSFFFQNKNNNQKDVFTMNDYNSTAKANESFEPVFSPEVINTSPDYYPSQHHQEAESYQPGYYPPNQHQQEHYQSDYPHDSSQSPAYNGYSQAPHTFESHLPHNQQYHHDSHHYDQKQPY